MTFIYRLHSSLTLYAAFDAVPPPLTEPGSSGGGGGGLRELPLPWGGGGRDLFLSCVCDSLSIGGEGETKILKIKF
jgi:hypothetical protein